MDFDFSDIVEQSRSLCSLQHASKSPGTDPIPRLERALPQIDVESRRLAPHSHLNSTPADYPQALRLLSEYGFETDTLERSLQSVALLDAFEPFQATPDTDVQSFLSSQAELIVAAAIDSAFHRAKSHSLASLSTSIDAQWDAAKRDLVAVPTLPSHAAYRSHSHNSASMSTPAFASPFRQPRSTRNSALFHSSPQPSSSLSFYHPIVRQLVSESRPSAAAVPLATLFDDALLAHMVPHGDVSTAPKSVQHLHAIFNALRYITGEFRSEPITVAAHTKLSVSAVQQKVCLGALRFLCLQFREDKMRKEIEARPVEARRGGVPGVKADVRAFLNLVFDRGVPDQLSCGPMYDAMPVWAFVYYCLRAGYVDEAAQVVEESIANGCNQGSLRLFGDCLNAYIQSGDRRAVPKPLLEKLVQDYGVSVKRGEDPYARVCYILLARVDPSAGDKVSLCDSDYGLLFYSIEDYLWLRLSVARLEGDESLPGSLASYSLSMKDIAVEIEQFGPNHFNADGDSAMLYALVLILTGQFAPAIEYLEDKGRSLTEAVHIAFVLYYYGIVRDGGPQSQLLSDKDSGGAKCSLQMDFSGLVWRYVVRLSGRDANMAAVYIFTLRDRAMRKALVKRLLLESQGVEMIVGQGGSGHTLNELWRREEVDGDRDGSEWRAVVAEAGEEAERRGERERALKLYEIGGVDSKIVEIHMKRVSAEMCCRGSGKRDRVFKEARQLLETRGAHGMELSGKMMGSLHALVEMGEFFDLRWADRFEEAITVLERMRMLPREEGEVVNKVAELGFGSRTWTSAVVERVPELIVGAMEALGGVHRSLSAVGASSEQREKVRSWARSLVNLSGMMRNLSADMSARLVGLEVLMN